MPWEDRSTLGHHVGKGDKEPLKARMDPTLLRTEQWKSQKKLPCLAYSRKQLLKKPETPKPQNEVIGFFLHREYPITWLENLTQPHHCIFIMFCLQHRRDGMGSALPGSVFCHHSPFLNLNQQQQPPQKSSFPTKVQKHQEKDPFLSSAPAPPRQLK